MIRLKSTKTIIFNNLETIQTLLSRTDSQITQDYHSLSRIKGSILRTKNEKSFIRIKDRLEVIAVDMGYPAPTSHEREHLFRKVRLYKKRNSYLRYAATHQALINICLVYEDFIRRVMLKYYEENIRRIPSGKESLKNGIIIDSLIKNENIHRVLAEKVVDGFMYASVEKWHATLVGFGMKGVVVTNELKTIFLIRNCFVHNNKKVSPQLHAFKPTEYRLRDPIHLTVGDIGEARREIERSIRLICKEYTREFPKNQGTWLSSN